MKRLAEAPKVLAEIAYVLHLTRQIREEIVRERSSPVAASTRSLLRKRRGGSPVICRNVRLKWYRLI